RGYRHTLAVMPNSPWGQKNLDLFKSKWTQDDRVLVDTAYYQPTGDYNGFIKDILGVNKSEQRSARIRRLLGTRLEFIPRRRRDLDFIFLVGNADQAASLKPALSFYYAENVPVFATSTIHDNSQKRLSHMDLNNIEFCEMPFKLDIDDPLHREITGNWQASQGNLAPFYAMGIDAYHIYPRLKQMQQVSGFKLSGATGLLSLNDRNVVTRQLMWAQFYEGNVRHLPILISIHDQR
ncbi:MAG: penicillin-binding protein activator, partial [Gammaproteobacteria bacterium]|nr:penicillin-binding protein activator [Gammaproteobacteria bacterium]